MPSLAYSLSYEGGSRQQRGIFLPPLCRAGLLALFLGLTGLDVTRGFPYADLNPVWATMPVFGGLVRAFLVCGILGAVFVGPGIPCILLVLGALGSTAGLLALMASEQWALQAILGHAARVGLPAVAVFVSCGLMRHPGVVVRALLMLTLLGYGLHSLGWPTPRPESSNLLMSGTIGLEADAAAIFFIVAGVLDLLAVVLLFVPRLMMAALAYTICWGLASALIHPWAHLDLSGEEGDWLPSVCELLTRTPHFLLPLALLPEATSDRRHRLGKHRLDISAL